MKPFTAVTLAIVVGAGALSAQSPASAPTPQKHTLSAFLLNMNDAVQRDLVEAAELMPEEHYGFKPAAESRPFGPTVAHIALSRIGSCSALLGRENPRRGQREDTARTKAEIMALLKEAGAVCAEAQRGLTEASIAEFITLGAAKSEVAKGVFIAGEIAHGYEVYGTMAVHLRLKGLVPPTTARRAAAARTP
jgi:hypothetical protein